MKKRRLELALFFFLILSSVAVFAQTFEPAFNLLRSLDPINVIYRLMQPLVDFTIVFAIFYSIARIVYMNQYGNEDKIKPLIVGVGIALSGSFVWFLQKNGWTLFSLLGNFSFFLVILLLVLFLYHMFKTQGTFEKDKGQRIALFILIVLVLFKSLLGVKAWEALLPEPMKNIVEIIIAIGLLVCLVSFVAWFIPQLSLKSKMDSSNHLHSNEHGNPHDTVHPDGHENQHPPQASSTAQPHTQAQSPNEAEAQRQANVLLSAQVQSIDAIVQEIRQLAQQMGTYPDPQRVKVVFDATEKRLFSAMQRFTDAFKRMHDLHIIINPSLKQNFVDIMGTYIGYSIVFEQNARNRGVI